MSGALALAVRRLGSAATLGAALAVCSLLAACGGTAPRTVARARRPVDEASQLAGQLPRRASRCVVARPSRLSPGQRALVQQVAQAGPLAWLGALEIRAYASASDVDADGRRSEVILMRASDPLERVRAVLSAQPYLDLVWDGEVRSCEEEDCAERVAHAEVLVDGTVRIRVGREADALAGGTDARRILSPCQWLAAGAREILASNLVLVLSPS